MKITTPKEFLQIIPKNLKENLEFRKNIHSKIAKDKGLQKIFLQLCREEPRIFYNAVAWTLDPRIKDGSCNLPFILRPKQDEAVLKVNNCIKTGKDGVIDKSKDEGASEILTKITTNKFLLIPDTLVRVGSRIEDLVDKTGDKTTLFAKIDYCINNLPIWWKLLLGWDGKNKVEDNGFSLLERTSLHLRHREYESTIDGEATSPHFGAGRRSTFMVLDELGRVDANIADKIIENSYDITDCALYNSTHFYGPSHPFAKLLKRDNIEVIKLLWYNNPEKNKGLYESPKVGTIQILDKEYYLKKYPEVFAEIDINRPFDYIEFSEKYSEPNFIADGKEKQPIILRSVWHDLEERQREWGDLCRNVWAYPAGATDVYFDSFVNDRVRSQFVRNPKFQGDIVYKFKYKNGVRTNKIELSEFKKDFGNKPLKWWGNLVPDEDGKLRPIQSHNYIIGCDISFGTGNSNSTAMIRDANTKELIGEYVVCNTSPDDFAYLVSALALWIGGVTKFPYIIWERNGVGRLFGKIIIEQGFTLIYTDTVEDGKTRTRKKRYGWTSTGGQNGTKNLVLSELKNAIKESLNKERASNYIIVYSEELVNELDSYMWFPSGDADSGENIDLSTGARARHGDRIIGTALTILADKEQPKAVKVLEKNPPVDSFAWRMERRKQIEAEKKNVWGEKRETIIGW